MKYETRNLAKTLASLLIFNASAADLPRQIQMRGAEEDRIQKCCKVGTACCLYGSIQVTRAALKIPVCIGGTCIPCLFGACCCITAIAGEVDRMNQWYESRDDK